MRTSQILKSRRIDNRFLGRLVVLMVIAAILITVAFGVYYYADRYVRFGDKSPVQLEIEHIEGVVAANPQDLEARLTIAQLYYENGEYSKAIQHAEAVSKAHPDDSAPLFLLGVVYGKAGQIGAAVEALEHLAKIRRESPMAQVDRVLEASLYYLGANYIKLNQADQAIEVLSEALQIDGTDADVFYQLGLAYAVKEDHERSIEAYQSAVRFVPDFSEAYQGMAEAYDALDMSSQALYARGMMFFSTKDYRQAQQELELAGQGLPDFVPVYLGLALTYEQQGDYQLALKNIERVLELEPDNFNANVVLGRIQSSESGS
ncbi:MAG: tetratricopeptide repeat protein [Candidatus Promineifilaceae bacterium]